MGFIKKINNISQSLKRFWGENNATIKMIMKENLSISFFSRLKRGEVIIPFRLLKLQLHKALEGDKSVEFDYFISTDSHIGIGVIYRKFFMHFRAEIKLTVDYAKLTNDEQKIIMRLWHDRLIGANLIGKVVAVVINSIVKGIFRKPLIPEEIEYFIKYDRRARKVIVDLSRLDAIKRIVEGSDGSCRNILDFISVVDIKHSYRGLIVKVKTIFSMPLRRNGK